MDIKIKTYFLITIGCQMNKSDSERLAGYLESCGLKTVADRRKAGMVIINTCGVRQSAEDRVYGLVKTIREENPKVKLAITGCLAEREDVKIRLKGKVDAWIPITEIPNFQFLISNEISKSKSKIPNKIQNAKFKMQNFRNGDYLRIEPIYSSKISAFIPIGNGCNNFCSYCVVPYTRGRETWRPAGDIIKEIVDLTERGYKEITLIAQNVNSYQESKKGKKQGSKTIVDFSKLLRMVNDIPGDFWVRFATSHPKDMSDELIRTISECEKVCEHVHLPIQAGDNTVLKAMNRRYTVKQYIALVDKIRKKIQITNNKYQINSKFDPEHSGRNSKFNFLPVSISTDVIVGFPGETGKKFKNIKKVFREIKFDQAFIARYSPRPGTAAFKLADNVPLAEKKRREQELEKIVNRIALANNKKYLGQTVEILVEGKNRKGNWHGRTRTNKNTAVTGRGNDIKTGDFIFVVISEANNFGLKGNFLHKKRSRPKELSRLRLE